MLNELKELDEIYLCKEPHDLFELMSKYSKEEENVKSHEEAAVIANLMHKTFERFMYLLERE